MEHAHAAGAIGGKALGASGGGCVVVIARDAVVDRVRAAVAPLGEIVPFAIDEVGLAIETVPDRVTAGGDAWA
jgi:D-glycero-alpha-D-manno-heptose-7-phosphate kinase